MQFSVSPDRRIPPPNIIIRALEAVGQRVYEMRDDFLA
jgi:phospholipid/cholesterol/gamma-HCH transport system permease protein